MLPIVASLMAQGFNILGNAIISKGQEVIEQRLGVKLEKTEPEVIRRLEVEHEEFLLDIGIEQQRLLMQEEANAQNAVTNRWEFDMKSDSYLAKNVRPIVLLYLTGIISLMAIFSRWLQVDPVFVDLLKISYGIVLTAYFVGRTVEKNTSIRKG